MKIIKEGQVLESKTRTGLNKFWQGLIYQDEMEYFIGSRHWQTKKDGESTKVTDSVPYSVVPKNLGKANETTPLEQAEFELASMIKQQRDKKNYIEQGKTISNKKLPLPQLAHKYRDHSKKIIFPCYEQPKLDGNRAVSDSTKFQTRGGQPFIPEVVQHLVFEHDGIVVDGEILLPGNVPLQVSMSAIKRFQSSSTTLLYCVYDIVDESLTFAERFKILQSLESTFPPNVKLVETTLVHNEDELQKRHEKHILDGYEGTIIRNVNGKYSIGHRSYDLQKKKDFLTAEFKVIGFKDGGGLFKGCAIFRCVTEGGEEFDSTPEGTIEYKKELYKNGNSYIGRWLTIRYFDTSLSGKPGFNVGVDFRDEGEF